MSTASIAGTEPWYRSLNANQWKTMIASNIGWMFDGYETFALILTVGVALHQLLPASELSHTQAFAGTVIGITLLGWGVGGVIGGILADYLGRRRTMILAILAYSLTTGLSALAWDWVSFALLRFVVGVAIGSEWATGASMTAEVWPDHARGRGAGLMQCGLGIGFFLASFIWLFISGYGPNAWRIMFLLGIVPGLFALWLRSGIDESKRWEATNEKRKSARAKKMSGAVLAPEEHALNRFTIADLFADPELRKRAIICFFMSLTTTLAWWGISTWVPPFVAAVAAAQHLPPQTWASYAAMSYNIGGIIGYAGLGFMADRFGRKPVVMLFFAASLVLTPALYMWTTNLELLVLIAAVNGIFTLGQYSWLSVWLPELFPTRMRATGMAFVFNAPRFIAFMGPLFAGLLIVQFGGFSKMAVAFSLIYILGFVLVPFLPETKGQPLPT
ncbi:MAG TPA: MFS transporter [Pseudolabrys sp.]|jgi:MFS family permease|uniref:MFS transporter n=1 Tax=Pseudolabrys sp. TaxID=1960880 RepID=UPI002DDCC243|nr:MFS transporter [Pseudolabrys sp.]HEV2627048.1 MFS transporter [Pseudolabrys sp.]